MASHQIDIRLALVRPVDRPALRHDSPVEERSSSAANTPPVGNTTPGQLRSSATKTIFRDTVVMLASAIADVLWPVGGIAAVVGLWWIARKVDPHWAAKDGRAFTCKVQPIDAAGSSGGRWRDARAQMDGSRVRLVVRGIGAPVAPFGSYEVVGSTSTPPKGKAVYLIRAEARGFALAIPEASRARAVLDAAAANSEL